MGWPDPVAIPEPIFWRFSLKKRFVESKLFYLKNNKLLPCTSVKVINLIVD